MSLRVLLITAAIAGVVGGTSGHAGDVRRGAEADPDAGRPGVALPKTPAGRQLAAIAELEADGRLARQPHVVRLVADARRETPEATFAELAERLELHRSTVQRALERVEWLAAHDDEPGGLGSPDVDGGRQRGRPDRAAGAAASA